MAKIFRRDNLIRNTKPKERVSDKRRKKNITVAFRVSPEEHQKIQTRVELSGLKKQEYYLQAILNQKLYAVGNVRTFDAMWKRIEEVDEHLQLLSGLMNWIRRFCILWKQFLKFLIAMTGEPK